MGSSACRGRLSNRGFYALRVLTSTEKEKCCPYFSMACSFSSSSFCRAITAMMIFLSSSVRWLRSGRSGMDGGTVGGRGPPWGPTEADIFSTTTSPPPPPPPPPRRVVSADRFPGAFPSHTSRHGPRAERQRQRQLWRIVQAAHGCRHPRLCFCCPLWVFLPLHARRRSPPPPACPPLPSTARIHGEPISVFHAGS